MGYLKTADIIVIALYALGVLAIGWWCARRQETTEEYFVGGRGFGSFIVGISVLASLMSSVSYLAYPGEMIKNGPGWLWFVLHIPISFIVIGYFVIPHIMKQKITSGYQLLEARLGLGIRRAAAVIFILSRLFWMGLVIFTCSKAVAAICGLPIEYVLIAVGIIGTLYTVMGGIRAVLLTDVIQYIILVGGALLTIGIVTYRCGGISGWWPDWGSEQLQNLHWQKIKVLSINPFDRLTAISTMLYAASFWICTSTSDQVVIQRFLCTKNVRAARRSFALTLLADGCSVSMLLFTGLALLGFYLHFPELLPQSDKLVTAQADGLFPHFIGHILPPGLSGLVLSALFAAAMSSLDSGINSISTVLVTDLDFIFARNMEDNPRAKLSRAKQIGLAVGMIAILMSLGVSLVPGTNILEKTVRISSFFSAPLFAIFAMAFFAKSSTPAGAWTAIAVGFLAGLVMSYWQQIAEFFGFETSFSIVLIMPIAALISFLAGLTISQFTKPREMAIEFE